jgi:hypothetical protein
VRICACACVIMHGRVCPRGLAAWWGQEAGRALCPGACFQDRQPFRGWIIGSIGSSSLLLSENYNRTTTDQTAELQSAQRLRLRFQGSLRVCELCAGLIRQPIDIAASLPRVLCLRSTALLHVGRATSASAGKALLTDG